MFRKYSWILLVIPFRLLGDQGMDNASTLGQRVALPAASLPTEVSAERYQMRLKEVQAEMASVLAKIGKTYSDPDLARLLRHRNAVLEAELKRLSREKEAKGRAPSDLIQLDTDAILTFYAEELRKSGSRKEAVRHLGARSAELVKGWVIRNENDPLLGAATPQTIVEVVNRNFLFDTKDETGLAPEVVDLLEKSRASFLDEQIGTAKSPALVSTESRLRTGKPR